MPNEGGGTVFVKADIVWVGIWQFFFIGGNTKTISLDTNGQVPANNIRSAATEPRSKVLIR